MLEISTTITFFLCLAGLAILVFGLSHPSVWMEQWGADRLSSSRPNPPGSLRADTVAAFASAIAAGFSAYAAVHTFSYLHRQEDILRRQLDATYFANLYNKQVETIAKLESARSDFAKLVFADRIPPILVPKLVPNSQTEDISSEDIASLHHQIKERIPEYERARLNIYDAYDATKLVFNINYESDTAKLGIRSALYDALNLPTSYANKIMEAPIQFENTSPDRQSWNEFYSTLRSGINVGTEWSVVVLPCLGQWLSQGQPITDERLQQCHMRLRD